VRAIKPTPQDFAARRRDELDRDRRNPSAADRSAIASELIEADRRGPSDPRFAYLTRSYD